MFLGLFGLTAGLFLYVQHDDDDAKLTGVVKVYSNATGSGLITPDNGDADIVVHQVCSIDCKRVKPVPENWLRSSCCCSAVCEVCGGI